MASLLGKLREAVRGTPDVDMWTGSDAGNGATKGKKWNSPRLQVTNQSLPLRTIRMQRDVNGISVIVSKPIVSG